MEELTLTIPTSLSEMSLDQFISLMQDDYESVLGIGKDELEFIPAETLERAYEVLDAIELTPAEFSNHFDVGGQTFIINWRMDEWTLEERLILDNLLRDKSINDLHKLVALHTRPARRKISTGWKSIKERGFWKTVNDFRLQKGSYTPKEWNRDEYEERVKLFYDKMPADRAYTVAVFFGEFGQQMLSAYTDKIVKM